MDAIGPKLERLKSESFEDLSNLPECESETTDVDGRRVLLTVWRDRVGENEVRIVIQAYRPWILGVGKTDAQGFRKDSAGRVGNLPSSELYEFL